MILNRKPDAVYIYGAPPESSLSVNGNETVFYDDKENDILIASVPMKNEYAYFGYLKKMILTLHNIIRMKEWISAFSWRDGADHTAGPQAFFHPDHW